jgi:oligoribonuclease NrnB/cAMP/cGMP phosphodiesterase (DHH superfamily)
MNIVIFTHYDLDGGGSAVIISTVIYQKYGKYPVVKYSGYEKIDERVLKWREEHPDDLIILTDISLQEETCEKLDGTKIWIYDHHENLDHLKKFSWVSIDTTYCATKNLFLKFSKKYDLKNYYNFVETVDKYDRWLWAETDEELPIILNDVWAIDPFKFLDKFKTNPYIQLSETEKVIYNMNKNRRKFWLSNMDDKIHKFQLLDYNVGTICLTEDISILGHYVLKKHADLDILFIVIPNNNTVSVRTKRDNIDLSLLCQHADGGGHITSGGFPLGICASSLFESILKDKFVDYK